MTSVLVLCALFGAWGFSIIIRKLNYIIQMNKKDFGILLDKLGSAVNSVKTDVEALLAKANAGEDFSEEGAKVQASLDALGGIHSEATDTHAALPDGGTDTAADPGNG